MTFKEKIAKAARTIRLAAEMSEEYYHKPLIICYSGGKDSDVMLDIAINSGANIEVQNSHTTADAPETVYHIRDVFKILNEKGIQTEIHMPTYKGMPTSMWKLIPMKAFPPTRIQRYCCNVLKETSTKNRIVAVGVRADESTARKGRDLFALTAKRSRPFCCQSKNEKTGTLFQSRTCGRSLQRIS